MGTGGRHTRSRSVGHGPGQSLRERLGLGSTRTAAILIGVAVVAVGGGAMALTSGSDEAATTSDSAGPQASAPTTDAAAPSRLVPAKPTPAATADSPALAAAVDAASDTGACARLSTTAEAAVTAVAAAMDTWSEHVFAQDEYDQREISFAAAELLWTETRLAADQDLATVDASVTTFEQAREECSKQPDQACEQRLAAAETVIATGQESLDQWRVHLADIKQSALPGHSRHVAWLDVWAEAKPALLAWPESEMEWATAPACA